MAALIAETKAAAWSGGLTDEEIDAELAAFKCRQLGTNESGETFERAFHRIDPAKQPARKEEGSQL